MSKVFKINYAVLCVVLSVFLGLSSHAKASGDQIIHVTIDDKLNAVMNWTIPVNTSQTTEFQMPDIDNQGYSASNSFDLIGAKDEIGPITAKPYGSEVMLFPTHYVSRTGTKDVTISYKMNSLFKKSFLIYELPFFTGVSYNDPKITFTYPDSLEFVSASHKVKKTNPLELELKQDEPEDLWYIVANFVEKKLPAGESEKRVGPYIIRGQPKYVDKLYDSAKELTFVKDMFSKVYGIDIPENIYILVSDLDSAKVNYEAGALAIPPNVMVFNSSALSGARKLDLAKTIIHETTHIAMLEKHVIFSGYTYYAPWFDEGLAVFSEYYAADNYLVKDEASLKKEDVLSGYRKFSIPELLKEYQFKFDYFFLNDDPKREIINSYSHAGLVFYNYFDKAGPDSIKKLLKSLVPLVPDATFASGDSDQILEQMKRISGLFPLNLLFPHKDEPDFDSKMKKFVRNTYTSEEEGKIAYDTFKNETKAYFGSEVAPAVLKPEVVEEEKTVAPPAPVESKIVEPKPEPKKDLEVKKASTTIATTTVSSTSTNPKILRPYDASKEIEDSKKPEPEKKSGNIFSRILKFIQSLF